MLRPYADQQVKDAVPVPVYYVDLGPTAAVAARRRIYPMGLYRLAIFVPELLARQEGCQIIPTRSSIESKNPRP